MTSPGLTAVAVSVRMRGIPEIVDSDWVRLTPGITVLTGRNNVGKTRILQAIAGLRPDAPSPGFVAQARLEADETTIEIELGPGGITRGKYEVSGPSEKVVASWEPEPNPEVVVLNIGDEVGIRRLIGGGPGEVWAFRSAT
jgi:energy-coupling factor transporter ATP-binding protein EcfA2